MSSKRSNNARLIPETITSRVSSNRPELDEHSSKDCEPATTLNTESILIVGVLLPPATIDTLYLRVVS